MFILKSVMRPLLLCCWTKFRCIRTILGAASFPRYDVWICCKLWQQGWPAEIIFALTLIGRLNDVATHELRYTTRWVEPSELTKEILTRRRDLLICLNASYVIAAAHSWETSIAVLGDRHSSYWSVKFSSRHAVTRSEDTARIIPLRRFDAKKPCARLVPLSNTQSCTKQQRLPWNNIP